MRQKKEEEGKQEGNLKGRKILRNEKKKKKKSRKDWKSRRRKKVRQKKKKKKKKIIRFNLQLNRVTRTSNSQDNISDFLSSF